MKFTQWLYLQKEGIIIGAGVGFAAFFIYMGQNPDLTMAVESPGLIDKLMTSTPVMTLVKYKLAIAFMAIGATVGAFIDSVYKPER